MRDVIAQARVDRVGGMCNQWGLDLTVGCEHDCGYCHFHKMQSLSVRQENGGQPVARALSVDKFLEQEAYPPTLYLSPFTDPLAPAARENLQRVLRRVLPLSVRVGISTKGIIPREVFRILADFPEQVLLFIGLSSLDEDRNHAVEPGCPPAGARLANFRLAREYGLPHRFARPDPVLPGVDDDPGRLALLLDRLAEAGAVQVSAAYLFLTPLANRQRLGGLPYLGEAVKHCNEPCPIAGGLGYSVPLDRKRQTYTWLAAECARRGLTFATCGCKDLRLARQEFSTACSHPYLEECAPGSNACSVSLPLCGD